jgi:hypothetical protein
LQSQIENKLNRLHRRQNPNVHKDTITIIDYKLP